MRRWFPSASRIELAQKCVYPWAIEVEWPTIPAGPAALYGSAFAEVSEIRGRNEVPDVASIAAKWNLSEADEKRLAEADERVVEVLVVDDAEWSKPEEPYAIDVTTGAVRLLEDDERGREGEMYGRSDLTFYRPGARVPLVVRDYKTGVGARGRRAEELPQLRVLALAAARLYDEPRVRVEIALVDEPDEIKIVPGELDELELGVVEAELDDIRTRIAEPPAPKPGPWCGRCPMSPACPATTAALARAEADLDAFPLRGPLLSAEHAAHNRHRLKVLSEFIEAREREIEDFARRSPLPIEGKPGVYWGLVQRDGTERIEATKATFDILREQLHDHAEIAIEKDVSKASIERAIKARVAAMGGKRGALTKAKTSVLDALRGSKLVKRGAPYSRFDEFKRSEAAE